MASGRRYIVYKHVNKHNGKVYIGVTSKTLKQRVNSGYYDNKCFYDDIIEYGWDGFNSTVVASNLTKDEAAKLEIELIKQFNSTNPNCGYNKSTGGFAMHKGCQHTSEAKEKCRNSSINIHRGENSSQSKPILKLSIDGDILNEYPSIGEAERQEGAFKGSIQRVLLGKRKTYKGCLYVYKDKGVMAYR